MVSTMVLFWYSTELRLREVDREDEFVVVWDSRWIYSDDEGATSKSVTGGSAVANDVIPS